MVKAIFTDRAGNKLYKKYIKTRKTWQYFGKNAEGKIVNPRGFNILARRAGLKIQKATKSGIQKRRFYI